MPKEIKIKMDEETKDIQEITVNDRGFERKLRIAVYPSTLGACGRYRLMNPMLIIKDMGICDVMINTKEVQTQDLGWADLVSFQRFADTWLLQMIEISHREGTKVIYDLDDNLFGVPKYNPFAQHWFKGSANLVRIELILQAVDLATVTTETLKEQIEKRARVVEILPNYQYFTEINRAEKNATRRKAKNPDDVVIAWWGSPTHKDDLEIAIDALVELYDEYPNIKINFFGGVPYEFLARFSDVNRIEREGVVEWDFFHQKLFEINADIAICPLVNNKFNRSKSNIKACEAAISDMVVIASDVYPYKKLIEDKEDGYLLKPKFHLWKDRLEELITDKEKRISMASKLKKKIEENYSLEKNIQKWLKTYLNVLKN